MGDIVADTARKMGITVKLLFLMATEEQKRFTNVTEVSDYRFERWIKYNEIPPWIVDWCLIKWRPRSEAI